VSERVSDWSLMPYPTQLGHFKGGHNSQQALK